MIRRYFRALGVELQKVSSRKLPYAALVLSALAVLVTILSLGVQKDVLQLSGEQVAASGLNGFELLADALRNGVWLGGIPLLILAALIMAEEEELGTQKILFSKPLRRAEIALAKGSVLALAVVLLVGFTLLVAAIAIQLKNGFYPVVDFGETIPGIEPYVHHEKAAMVKNALTASALLVPPLLGVLLLAFLLSSLSKQTGIAVGVSFGLVLVMLFGVPLFRTGEQYIVTSWLSYPTATLKALAQGISTDGFFEHARARRPINLSVGVSLVTGLVAWGVAALVTIRKEVFGWLAIALPAALLLGGAEVNALELAFRQTEHEVNGQVRDIDTVDLDGDGRMDLCVFVTTDAKGPAPMRYLALFYQSADGTFAKKPDQVVTVRGESVARVIADLDPGTKGVELGFITPDGLMAVGQKDRRYEGAPRSLIRDKSLFDLSNGGNLPSWWDGTKDVDGDKRADVLFLRKGDAVLHRQKEGGGFEEVGRFPLEYKQRFGAKFEAIILKRFLSFKAQLARPVLCDANGDGRLDLVTIFDRELRLYRQRRDGSFSAEPDESASLPFLVDDRGADDTFDQTHMELNDVNQDGKDDLLIFRNVGKLGVFESLKTQVLYYENTGRGWDMKRPNQVINLNGISMTPTLVDISGDGKRDLVVSALRTDLISNVGTALFSSVTFTYHAFEYKERNHRFTKVPVWSRDQDVDVGGVEGGGTIPYAYFWGDFDGDKRHDMVSMSGENTVTIRPSRDDRNGDPGFSDSDKAEVTIPTSNSNKIFDINADGKADMGFWYFDDDWKNEDTGLFRLLVSQ